MDLAVIADDSDITAELNAHVGFLIRRAQQVSIARFNAQFGRFGITPTQAICLYAIRRRPGIDQVAVGRLIMMDHATTAMVIATLEKAGYVARGIDPADRRRRVLTITRKGAALERDLGAFSDAGAQLLSMFEPGEAKTLVRLLSNFVSEHEKALRPA